MENTDKNEDQKTSNAKVGFAKLLLGTAAGYVGTKLAEHAFDMILEYRRNKTTENQS